MWKFHALLTRDQQLNAVASEITATVKRLLVNHEVTRSPIYDNQIIEITMAAYLIGLSGDVNFVESWFHEIVEHVSFAYAVTGKYFPIQTDSLEDAISLNVSGELDKEKLFQLSTLVAILAHWCAALKLPQLYDTILEATKQAFPNTTLEVWYPDETTDEHLYISNAGYESGTVEAPIRLPKSLDELSNHIISVQEFIVDPLKVSSIKYGFPILPLISSRHFRTPVIPYYWQQMILKPENTQVDSKKE